MASDRRKQPEAATTPSAERETGARRGFFRRRRQKPKKTLWDSTRETLDSILVALVLASIFRAFVMEAFEIPTGSMAPTLYGEHADVTCARCRYRYSVGREGGTFPIELVCPLCGSRQYVGQPEYPGDRRDFIDPAALRRRGGDRILVDKGAYTLGNPRRWDVGVFVNPNPGEHGESYIKRVVGLPGDTLQIRNGDIYVNGVIAAKPDHVQEVLWFPVFDSRHAPNRSWERPWRPGLDLVAFTEHVTQDETRRPAWLAPWRRLDAIGTWDLDGPVFSHRAAGGDPGPSMLQFAWPVEDVYAYGQRSRRGGPSRDSLSEVGDVRLRAVVTLEGPGAVYARIAEDDHVLDYVLSGDPARPSSLTINGEPGLLQSGGGPLLVPGRAARVAFVNVDDRAWMEVDGRRPLGVLPYGSRRLGQPPPGGPAKAIYLGAAGPAAHFAELAIDRDIYYTRTERPDEAYGVGLPVTLKADQFFVLGDHSPSSRDSRRWPNSPVVPRDLFIGKAMILYWPHIKNLDRIKIIH